MPHMVEEGSWIMAILYPWQEEVEPAIQCRVLPPPCKFLEEAKLLLQHGNLPKEDFKEEDLFQVLQWDPPLSRAPGRGWNWIPVPVSSIGSQGRNVPFRGDMVESAIRTAVLVANGHPSVPPPLETVYINDLQPPSPEILPRVRISVRNGVEHMVTWWEVPRIFWQELPPWNPTRYIEGGVHRNGSSVWVPQSMLVNRVEYGTQVQPRINWDRLVAALANPSYLTWQEVACSLGQVADHLVILVNLLVILQSHGIMGNPDVSSTMKDYQDTLVVFLSSIVEDPLMTQEGPLASPGGGPPKSPGGGSSGSPGDSGSQGPPSH